MHLRWKNNLAGLYSTPLWRALRKARLAEEPLCRMHAHMGEVVAATVVDHIIPHRGNLVLFGSYDNTQSLCKHCHDSTKQQIEKRGYSTVIGADGWPTDPNHPSNKNK